MVQLSENEKARRRRVRYAIGVVALPILEGAIEGITVASTGSEIPNSLEYSAAFGVFAGGVIGYHMAKMPLGPHADEASKRRNIVYGTVGAVGWATICGGGAYLLKQGVKYTTIAAAKLF